MALSACRRGSPRECFDKLPRGGEVDCTAGLSPPGHPSRFRLPDGLLVERDGYYQLKLTEPMEENAYLDSARLHIYDLPVGWSMIMDDRMVVAGPPATGRPIFYRTVIVPVSAVNDRGDDVTDTIARRDHVAAPAGELDHRFVGRLKGDHSLTLEFDQVLSADNLVLAVDGWVEYPYSQTVFAAWQAGEEYSAPTLEARDAYGVWPRRPSKWEKLGILSRS